MRSPARAALPVLVPIALVACRDLSRFSSGKDSYEGPVVKGDFVRSGIDSAARACVALDTDHLQDAPGRISTSDGRFRAEPLRPIPQIWHDPLSTLSFGDGREKNLVYVATPTEGSADAADAGDVMVVISLMTSGGIEVRLLRGAPAASADGGAAGASTNVFGVFQLTREEGPCSY